MPACVRTALSAARPHVDTEVRLAAWFKDRGPRQLTPRAPRRLATLTFASLAIVAGCTGTLSGDGDHNVANGPHGPGSSGGSAATDPGGIGNPDDPVIPFEAGSLYSALRKVKGLLVGLPPTDEEVQILVSSTN